MDSRPLLKGTKKVNVFLDSNTFEELLDKNDKLAIAILTYSKLDCLEFIRTPLPTKHDNLKEINEYQLVYDSGSEITGIKCKQEKHISNYGFNYKIEDISTIAQEIYHKKEIDRTEFDIILTVFIQSVFNFRDSSLVSRRLSIFRYGGYEENDNRNIYITNEKVLLENRLWFENHFPGVPLNIMSIEESSHFIDLFLKNNNMFHASYWLTLIKDVGIGCQ